MEKRNKFWINVLVELMMGANSSEKIKTKYRRMIKNNPDLIPKIMEMTT